MTWNVNSLKPKLSNFDFVNFCCQYDIFSLSEINNVLQDEITNVFENYEVYISYRTSCGGGGVALCVKKMFLPFISRVHTDMEECIFIYFNEVVFGKPVLMSFPYIAHEGSVFYNNKLLNGIENFELQYENLKNRKDDVQFRFLYVGI